MYNIILCYRAAEGIRLRWRKRKRLRMQRRKKVKVNVKESLNKTTTGRTGKHTNMLKVFPYSQSGEEEENNKKKMKK